MFGAYFHPACFFHIQAYCAMEKKINCTALRSLTVESKENTVNCIKSSPRGIDPEVLADTKFSARIGFGLPLNEPCLPAHFFLLFAFRFPTLCFLPIKLQTNLNGH